MQGLVNEGKSELTIQNKMDTIKSFYNRPELKIPPFNGIENSASLTRLENHKSVEGPILDKSHIKDALNMVNIRDKALILLHFTSGLSPQMVRDLSYDDFLKAMDNYLELSVDVLNMRKLVNHLLDKQELIGRWKITRNNGDLYYTFNSTESTQAILDYLLQREISGQYVENPEDPLFVNQRNIRLKKSTYDGIFNRINKKLNINNYFTNKKFITPSQLKKSFKNSLIKGGAPKIFIDSISGYRSGLSWDEEVVENLRINYKRNCRFLLIKDEDKVKELETKLKKTDLEINELRTQIKYLKHLVDQDKRN